jgi:hypothetical protein
MATVAEPKAAAPKYATEVDEQIAQATSRIRAHDLTFGGLLLAALVLVYATAMILTDKYVILPEWVRQLSLAGFLVVLGGAAYWTIVRPLRRRVNPLYAAVQVEKTVEDAKNSVVGYVEAQEKGDVHPAVKAAMGARAAKSVGAADVNQAVDHRSLVYTGAVAITFLLALVVLFFVFRPAQFSSLVGRAFVPFSSAPIESRTQLTLVAPAGGDVTITAGQSVTVKVQVGGKVPAADRPDRVRMLLRHTPTTPDYEEVPLEQADTSREWQVRVPDYLVRNGFWYKVAGGDAATPEYRVTVRSLPLFTEFEVAYEYPAYTRMKPETTKVPQLEAIRGTKVTLTARTNRTVKDGRLTVEPTGQAIQVLTGKVPADKPDSVQFQFTLTTAGTYRVSFTSAEGERSSESSFPIKVIEDQKPTVEIVKPEEAEVTIPANGQLAVDGTAGDDFGIAKLTLRMRLTEPEPRALAAKPYLEGKSFKREKDGSYPTSLEYKDSVDFTKLTDEGGAKVELKEGMVIEYWLEATDNRTKLGAAGPDPDPNVGKSEVKRVRVGPPVMAPADKKTLDERKDRRKTEEQQHNQQQQQKFDNEKRDPNQKPGAQQNQPQPQDGAQQAESNGAPTPMPKSDVPEPKGMPPEPKTGDPMMPPMNQEGTPKKDGTPMNGGMGDPMPPMPGMPMSQPNGSGMNNTPQAPRPSTPEQKDLERQAQDIQNKINDQNSGGSAKSGPSSEEQRANPGDQKPPMADGMPQGSPPKDGPKPNDPMGGGNAAEPKPAGNVEPPQDPSQQKPEPKADGNPMSPMGGGTPPAEPKAQPKPDPMTGGMGQDKPTPQPKNGAEPMPMGDANKSEDPSGGGSSKPATQQKPQSGMGSEPMPGQSQKNPAAGAAKSKPMPSNDRASDQPPAGNPMGGGNPQDPNRQPDEGAGRSKPQSAPQPSGTKPAPNADTPMPGGGDLSEPKPMPGDGMGNPMSGKPSPSEPKPDGSNPMGSQGAKNTTPPGQDKGTPQAGGGNDQKADRERQKEFENAVKDLASNDPATKKAAQDKLDNMVGQQNRKDIEKKVEDFKDAVNNLNSKDEHKRAEAEKKLDNMVGEQNRKEMQDIAKGLNSKDSKERQAAEQKLKDLQQKASGEMPKGAQQKAGAGDGPKPKIDPKEVEQAAKDLASGDPQKQQAARDKLDKTVGPEARKQAEQLMNDLKSDDPQKRAAAQKKIDEMKKQAEEMARNNPEKKGDGAGGAGKKVDPKEVEQALDDLNSNDPQKRQAAKQKLDDMLGKGTGDKAEQMTKDINSNDPEKQGPARKQRDDLLNKAEQMAKGEPKKPQGKPLSEEEAKQLAEKLNDLNSKDEAKRKAAEQEIDKQIGEQARKELQEAMNDPQKAEELKRKLEEMAKNGGGELDPRGNAVPKGAGSPQSKVLEAMKEDARNRAKSAQLQLEQFEKNKGNQELLKDLGMTPEQYQKFLDNFRNYSANLKKEADDLEKADAAPPAGTLPATNISDGRKIESRGGASGSAGAGQAGFAAPGYTDALKRFQEEATKVPTKKQP